MQVGPGGRWVGTEPNYSAEPRRGGLVKWAYGRSTEHLDPALIGTAPTVLAVGQVYSRIVRCAYPLEVARSGQPFSPTSCLVVGDLADSWDVSADGKTYTFHLHPGVKWQNTPPVNGREFSADDVLWNIKRYQTTGTQKQNFSLIKDASAPDKNTVVVNLDAAYPDLLAGVFAPSEALMLPHEIADQDGDFKQRAVGTGPFIMTEFQRDIKITYTRNPDYFRPGLPYLDALQIDFVPDLSTRRAAYKTGEYQFVQDNGSTWEDVQNISRSVPDTVVWEQDPISSHSTTCASAGHCR
jgi:ABC-type transport system substrate-binding protein